MAEPSCLPFGLDALVSALDPARPLVIQTHDFPDLDAVASAWGLSLLLARRGLASACVYRGRIRSRSLASLVSQLGLNIANEVMPRPEKGRLQLIVVDGSPVNGNVSLFDGELVAVVDHHRASCQPLCPYSDIRPEMASCSAIIEGYWRSASEPLPADAATALLAGIQSDTDFLSRRASPEDFSSYYRLVSIGDFSLASRVVRTVFDLAELDLVIEAMKNSVVRDGVFWAWIKGPCSQEVLAVLAEFVLRTEEIQAAVVAEHGEPALPSTQASPSEGASVGGVHLSVRSKDKRLPAFDLVRGALQGMGSAGGHSHAAGGFIPESSFPGEDALRERFFSIARTI